MMGSNKCTGNKNQNMIQDHYKILKSNKQVNFKNIIFTMHTIYISDQ